MAESCRFSEYHIVPTSCSTHNSPVSTLTRTWVSPQIFRDSERFCVAKSLTEGRCCIEVPRLICTVPSAFFVHRGANIQHQQYTPWKASRLIIHRTFMEVHIPYHSIPFLLRKQPELTPHKISGNAKPTLFTAALVAIIPQLSFYKAFANVQVLCVLCGPNSDEGSLHKSTDLRSEFISETPRNSLTHAGSALSLQDPA